MAALLADWSCQHYGCDCFLCDTHSGHWVVFVRAGVVFALTTVRWHQRYLDVLNDSSGEMALTGELYANPGAEHLVAVWQEGIRREHVQHP
ncbi:MAG: hypothetical protein M1499_08255 [Firmicutes bacterium]|nr:hypothetical protein [Bacillota bacterium]